jgi:histidine ammonia-lyase
MDLFTNRKPGEGTLVAYKAIRDAVPHLEKDRVISKDIETITELMRSGKILEEVEEVVGELQ